MSSFGSARTLSTQDTATAATTNRRLNMTGLLQLRCRAILRRENRITPHSTYIRPDNSLKITNGSFFCPQVLGKVPPIPLQQRLDVARHNVNLPPDLLGLPR